MNRIANVALLAMLTGAANAEPLFISDKLMVSVYVEANQESERITTLDSGDAVEGIEKAEGFTHVRLADGREGWIKSSYLSAQTPAIVRLKELEKERAASTSAVPASVAQELTQLKEQNVALRNEVENLKRAASQAPAAKPAPVVAPAAATERNEIASKHALQWGTALALGAGVIGFGLGYRTISNRIARKYGKLKIY